MKKYLASDKISDAYLEIERKKLMQFQFYSFPNSFEERVRSLEKIEDKYEQLKVCMQLQNEMRTYICEEAFVKSLAVYFLNVAEFAVTDKVVFYQWFDEQDEYTIISFYDSAVMFFSVFTANSSKWWEKYNISNPKTYSSEFIKGILEIGKKFFDFFPKWVRYAVRIEASTLSLSDKFFKHVPRSVREKKFKKLLKGVIKSKPKDFYRLRIDPSANRDGEIYYQAFNEVPMMFSSPKEWQEKAKLFEPVLKSRLGTKDEYVAFLGVLIKNLVAEGWSVSDAWNCVCNDSNELGVYYSSGFAKTRSMRRGGFCDLANTYKLLYDEFSETFWYASGSWCDKSNKRPLACITNTAPDNEIGLCTVGWIVFELIEKK